MKMLNTQERFCNSWFWRTQQQQEIDLVEEENGALRAFEFKWNPKKGKANIPASFAKAYPHATYTIVTPDNVDDFLLPITT